MLPAIRCSLFLALLFSVASLPGQSPPPAPAQPDAFQLPFQFSRPDRSVELDKELDEISGLSIAPDGRRLVAVQDEEAIIYWLDPVTGQIENQKEFWKEGDYEGIETATGDIWVLKSTGTLYRVREWGFDQPAVDKYNGPLTKENDVEGLGYLQSEGTLLLACKEKAGDQSIYGDARLVYAFDPRTETFSERPRFVISRRSILDYLDRHPEMENFAKVRKFYEREDFDFSPSAIAMDPVSGYGYQLSSVGKFLLVFHPSGRVLHVEKLDKTTYPQPEALCFDGVGNLYVASEGKDGRARLLFLSRRVP
jgi:hypothetical protein